MPENYQYSLMLNALRDAQAELGQTSTLGTSLFPRLSEMLEAIGRLPSNAILFGIASDGLPLLLHLRDPRPGPVLVVGDRGSGKTAFLKAMLWAASQLNRSGSLHFAVLSEYPDEWARFQATEHLAGIWPAYEQEAETLLFDLACRAQARQDTRPVILLFDGLDSILHMEQATQNNFRYLLSHGPPAYIWPVVTINSSRAMKLPEWLAHFRTRIYGRITHPASHVELAPVPGAPLKNLFPGFQFCIREKSRWLQFWLPGMAE